MAIVDAHGYLTYASPATERILGLDSEALVGTNTFDLIHPEDRPRALQAFDVAKSDPDSAERVEFRMNHADGGWCTIEAMSTNLLHDPSIEGLVVSARDVTDRRRAEAELREAQERFRSAFEHAPIGMALMALDGHAVPREPRDGRRSSDVRPRSSSRATIRELTHRRRPRRVRRSARPAPLGRGAELPARPALPPPRRPPGLGGAELVARPRRQRELALLRVPDGRHHASGGRAARRSRIRRSTIRSPACRTALLFVDRLGRELRARRAACTRAWPSCSSTSTASRS